MRILAADKDYLIITTGNGRRFQSDIMCRRYPSGPNLDDPHEIK